MAKVSGRHRPGASAVAGGLKAKNKIQIEPEAARRRGLWYFAAVAIFVFAAFELYGPALHGPFVYDDFSLPYYNRLFHTERFVNWVGNVRPLLMLSYWINFQLSGRDPHWYHVFNVLFHVANSAAVYLIVLRILGREAIDDSRRQIVAVFAAALFLVHPVQTESVAWVAGRSESLSAVFFLWALTLFLYRPTGAIGWDRSALILFLFACAVASKEHTATLPIVLLLTDLWWAPEGATGAVRRNWRLYVPMLLGGLAAGKFIWNVVSSSQSAGFGVAGVSALSYALAQCRVIWVYLRLFLFPVGQNIDYDMPWSPSHFQFATFAGFLGIVALAAAAWHLRRRFPVGSYGLILFLILLAPTSSFVPIKDPIAERRLYLPMLGLVLVASEFLIHSIQRRSSIAIVASLLIVPAAMATYHRNRLWGSEAALWEDTVAKSPNKLRGYGHLVHGLILEHHCREALQRLDELSRRMPVDPTLLGHWAVAYECVHEPEHALEKLELASVEAPSALTYVDMARNQLALEHPQDALQSLNQALKLDPTSESAYVMRAELYERQNNLSAAATDYGQALRLDPANQQIQLRLRQISGSAMHP